MNTKSLHDLHIKPGDLVQWRGQVNSFHIYRVPENVAGFLATVNANQPHWLPLRDMTDRQHEVFSHIAPNGSTSAEIAESMWPDDPDAATLTKHNRSVLRSLAANGWISRSWKEDRTLFFKHNPGALAAA